MNGCYEFLLIRYKVKLGKSSLNPRHIVNIVEPETNLFAFASLYQFCSSFSTSQKACFISVSESASQIYV